MLLPSISNTANICLSNINNLVNTDKPCCKRLRHVQNVLPDTQQDFKNSLTTKLLTNINFLIVHKKCSW